MFRLFECTPTDRKPAKDFITPQGAEIPASWGGYIAIFAPGVMLKTPHHSVYWFANDCKTLKKALHTHQVQQPATPVVFRQYPDSDTVIALFPYQIESKRHHLIQSYIHDGQHGQADYEAVIAETRPATPAECQPLKQELEARGYELQILKRKSNRKYLQSYNAK